MTFTSIYEIISLYYVSFAKRGHIVFSPIVYRKGFGKEMLCKSLVLGFSYSMFFIIYIMACILIFISAI